jgi:hypothetical protein
MKYLMHNKTTVEQCDKVEVNLRPTVRRSVCHGVRLLSGAHDQIFSVWQLSVSWCGAPSLSRRWVCNLLIQLLLGLARATTLGYKSCRTYDHILLVSHMRLLQPGGPDPRIYIPQEQGGPVIPLRTGFPFRRLLRLAYLRWRYFNPPPHGKPNNVTKWKRQTYTEHSIH